MEQTLAALVNVEQLIKEAGGDRTNLRTRRAVEAGLQFWRPATQKRVRCRNPGVSVSDIIDGMGNAEYSTKNNSFPITLRDCAESKFSI